jgi:hypothetical protein
VDISRGREEEFPGQWQGPVRAEGRRGADQRRRGQELDLGPEDSGAQDRDVRASQSELPRQEEIR